MSNISAHEVEIVKLPFLIPTWARAQVILWNTVWVRRDVKVTIKLLSHELVHIEQQRRYGLWSYWWRYLNEARKYEYFSRPMEVEADDRAKEYENLAELILYPPNVYN